MLTTTQTTQFAEWLSGLKDHVAKAAVVRRIERLQGGLFGDCKSVGGGVSELRLDVGPGYRVYFTRRGDTLVVLLVGGTKRTQQADIEEAQRLAAAIPAPKEH